MSEPSTSDQDGRSTVAKAWINWALRFVPFMALILIANVWIEFNLIMGALVALLGATLLYQRYVNMRSWNSILWGVHVSDD